MMRWSEPVALEGKKQNKNRVLVGKLKEREHLEDAGVS
jgi:hypothetical protein